jgi:hypothetical protein
VEGAYIADRLSKSGFASVEAIRLQPYSSRFYFVIDADTVLRGRLEGFAERWGRCAELYRGLA